MNSTNLDALIAHLEKVPEGSFNMKSWITTKLFSGISQGNRITGKRKHVKTVLDTQESGTGEHECGTVACIAGHAAIVAIATKTEKKTGISDYTNASVYSIARNWLDVDNDLADDLFLPDYMEHRTLKQAIKVLKKFRKTGMVKWPEHS